MRNLILAIWKVFIRTSAFLLKEIAIIVRQPRLLLTLVLGPFFILLIFGLGYQNKAPVLRTLFVVQPGSKIEQQIKDYAPTLGPQLVYMGITADKAAALQRLEHGEVDLVVVAPPDALATIQAGHQAEFQLYHAEIDPLKVSYIDSFGRIYIDEVNRRVLQAVTTQSQAQAEKIQPDLQDAQKNVQAAEQAIQINDKTSANQHLIGLSSNLDQISLAVDAGLSLLNDVDPSISDPTKQQVNQIQNQLDSLRALTTQLINSPQTSLDGNNWTAKLKNIDTGLQNLRTLLETFTQINPQVVVSPFDSKVQSITKIQPDATQFYAPSVIALLLQHLAVTIAALSIVHERNYGALELFRVSPLSAAEVLVGKYLSYLLFGVIVAVSLSALMHLGLGVPMLGNWVNYAVVIGAILFTSLGIGFVISLISRTDSQAIQYAMIVLLTSVFFSGFFINLDMLVEPVRALSWLIPTTYGIVLLREITLRGISPNLLLLSILISMGVMLCFLAWLILRRIIANR
jgi:ABC-2 type transport system permease protein